MGGKRQGKVKRLYRWGKTKFMTDTGAERLGSSIQAAKGVLEAKLSDAFACIT